jgi:hypothetical protein
MCIVSDKVKFCSCITGNYKAWPHYWLLYRIDGKKKWMFMGEPIVPEGLLEANYELNRETLASRLNESDAFDLPLVLKPKDRIMIVINNLAKDAMQRMTFCFSYKNGKWVHAPYDSFEMMNQYDEIAFGKFDNLDSK